MSPRRSTLRLAEWRVPPWKRPGLWQAAALVVALAPCLIAGYLWLAPLGRLPEPAAPERAAMPALRPLTRENPDPGPAERIAAANLFAAAREDWPPVAAAVAGGEPKPALDELKAALDALDKFVVVAIIRTGDERVALLDPGDRKPGDDLTTLRAGDEQKGWTIEAVERDRVEVARGDTRRTLRIGPKPPPAPVAAETSGRRRVEYKEVAGPSRRLIIDPPISVAEVRTQLMNRLAPEEVKLRDMVDQLLEQLEKERGGRPAAPPPPEPKR